MFKSYSEKLKDPRWQKRRLQELERAGWACEWCSSTSKTLHVHHWLYRGEPWEALDETLSVLCEDCHREGDEVKALGEEALAVALARSTPFIAKEGWAKPGLVAFALGMAVPDDPEVFFDAIIKRLLIRREREWDEIEEWNRSNYPEDYPNATPEA